MEQGMDSQSKLKCLMDLVKEMKGLHGKPKAVELEIHAEGKDPEELAAAEEMLHQDLDNDQEEGESPEHRALVLGNDAEESEESPELERDEHSEEHGIHPMHEEESDEDEELSPMELPPELRKLLEAHLMSKK